MRPIICLQWNVSSIKIKTNVHSTLYLQVIEPYLQLTEGDVRGREVKVIVFESLAPYMWVSRTSRHRRQCRCYLKPNNASKQTHKNTSKSENKKIKDNNYCREGVDENLLFRIYYNINFIARCQFVNCYFNVFS